MGKTVIPLKQELQTLAAISAARNISVSIVGIMNVTDRSNFCLSHKTVTSFTLSRYLQGNVFKRTLV